MLFLQYDRVTTPLNYLVQPDQRKNKLKTFTFCGTGGVQSDVLDTFHKQITGEKTQILYSVGQHLLF